MAEEPSESASHTGPAQDPGPTAVLPDIPSPSPITQDRGQTLYLAAWSARFWAWLIDFILIILFLAIVRGIFNPFWSIPPYWDLWHWEPIGFWFQTILFFAYWTVMEGFRGQSIGKMCINLKVVNRDGSKITYSTAAIESFGKAFLLPLDCLIGWLAMPDTKLRVFNRISHTIVIRSDYQEPAGIIYVKDKE